MHKSQEQVEAFHEAFGHPKAEKPTAMEDDLAVARTVWTGEELVEFLYATAEGNVDQFNDLVKQFYAGLEKAKNKIIDKGDAVPNKLVAQADALTDAKYFIEGSFVALGVDGEPLFDIVQNANMSKLWPDGKPRYREEDGKIKKPEGWEAPEPLLEKEIERQIKEA